MIGKTTQRRWRYAFNCKDCLQIRELHDGVHEGRYCMAMLRGEETIHADDDRILRCDCWQPVQRTLFDEETYYGEEEGDAES